MCPPGTVQNRGEYVEEQLDLLFELQQTDRTIDDATKRLAGLDDGAAKRGELDAERAQLEEMGAALEKTSTAQLDKELELESVDEERSEKWSRAYGGTVADPKELGSLEKKIQELDRRKDKLEDTLLELYDSVEKRTAQVQEQRETVAQLEKELAGIEEAFANDSAELNAVVTEAQERRAGIVSQLDAKLMDDYEGIRKKTGDLAVVEVNGRLCTGCRVSISIMLLDQLQKRDKIIRCENCRRILYWQGS